MKEESRNSKTNKDTKDSNKQREKERGVGEEDRRMTIKKKKKNPTNSSHNTIAQNPR